MISESRDYAPLSAACVRSLNDKLYEKRKPAAVEIEKMVKEFAARNNTVQIKRLLKVLGQDFATSQNPHTRKGGLIGLAAIAVGLGKETGQYTEDLVHPILACFCDPDVHVRYYACESLYNVVKIARGAVLPLFTDIFGALSKLACDSEQTVKNATELLDRLMKDIVTESGMFDLVGFMPLLRERIYTKNSFGRQFVIAWVSVLDAVPDMDFVIFLPEILDGLYRILEDPNPEIKKITDTVLGEFLRSVRSNPARVDFPAMINILIAHAQSTDEILQLTAITWIREFVRLSGPQMLPYVSGILIAVLPCLAYDGDGRKSIKETATCVNADLMKLVSSKRPKERAEKDDETLCTTTTGTSNDERNDEAEVEKDEKEELLAESLDLSSVVEVLTKHLMHTSVQTKVAVLKWIHRLFKNIPRRMYRHIDDLFPVLMRTLSDPSDEVVEQNLVVMAEIIGGSEYTDVTDFEGQKEKEEEKRRIEFEDDGVDRQIISAMSIGARLSHRSEQSTTTTTNNKYLTRFIVNLLRLFSTDRHLLEDRGAFIIRELCILLSAEEIYKILAEILLKEHNIRFACLMVQTLNMILLTSSELFQLRSKLKDWNSESRELFIRLYESWCHNPVATLALCLLTRNYQHACRLVRSFGNIEVTVEFLAEIDKLVQLIESPIFTYLRLELLERERNQALVRALYGLLMILPQSEAFSTLHRRLAAIPPPSTLAEASSDDYSSTAVSSSVINFDRLLSHFESVQEQHKELKRRQRIGSLIEPRESPEFQ